MWLCGCAQASLKEMAARHEDELKRLRKKLKAAHKEVGLLSDEVTDLRFRSHDLQVRAAEFLLPHKHASMHRHS